MNIDLAEEHARYAKAMGKIDPVYMKLHVWHLDKTDRVMADKVRKKLKKDIPLHPSLQPQQGDKQ